MCIKFRMPRTAGAILLVLLLAKGPGDCRAQSADAVDPLMVEFNNIKIEQTQVRTEAGRKDCADGLELLGIKSEVPEIFKLANDEPGRVAYKEALAKASKALAPAAQAYSKSESLFVEILDLGFRGANLRAEIEKNPA